MTRILALVMVLYAGAAMAQSAAPAIPAPPASKPAASAPPTVGGKPLLQVKPRAAAKEASPKANPKNANPKNLSIAKRLQACLEIEDGSKGRLDCYDTVFQPKPDPKAKPAKGVADCRFKKEEDERLTCFNGFAESIPQF